MNNIVVRCATCKKIGFIGALGISKSIDKENTKAAAKGMRPGLDMVYVESFNPEDATRKCTCNEVTK